MTAEKDAAKVWLIGGTSESAELARALEAQQIPFVVTVTSAAAKRLYSATMQVVVGQLTRSQMSDFVQQHQIVCVLDASHPFASAVSEAAIALTRPTQKSLTQKSLTQKSLTQQNSTDAQSKIAYLRYERAQLSNRAAEENEIKESKVSIYTSLEDLLNNSQLHHHSILFTLGYRSLLKHSAQLAQLRQKAKLFARVLPSMQAISAVIAAGFGSKEIIALRPPISFDLEKALWQQWNISLVVAKASGEAGGEAIKRKLAAELGVPLHLIERPPVIYPRHTSCLLEAVQFCSAKLSSSCSTLRK